MNFLKTSVLTLTAIAMALVAVSAKPVVAQSNDRQAAIVISLASVEEQLNDMIYLSDQAGFGALGAMVIKGGADDYLGGVDRTKPIGFFVHIIESNPEQPVVVGMIPVTDYDEVLDTMSQAGEVDDSGDIDVIAMPTGEDLYAVKRDGHAVISNNKDALDWAPADLAKALGEMPKKYNFSTKIYAQRIPASLRNEAIQAMRDGYQQQLDDSGVAGDDLQARSVELQMAQMESLINETDVLMIGMAADKEKKSIYFDFEMIGKEGSKLALSAAEQKNAPKSQFNGFMIKDAMMNAIATSKMTKDDIVSYKGLMAGFKKQAMEQMDLGGASEQEAAAVKGFFESFFAILNDTIDAGVSDGGMVVMGGQSPSMAFGFHAVNARRLDESLKKMAELANQSGQMQVEINAEKIGDMQLHKASIPVPPSEEEMLELFGDKINVYVGVNDQTVYMSAGDDSFTLLKRCIDGSSADRDGKQVEFNLYLANILKMAADIQNEEMMADMAEILKDGGNDRITIWSETVENGVKARFEIQDGVLKLIGVAVEQFGFGG